MKTFRLLFMIFLLVFVAKFLNTKDSSVHTKKEIQLIFSQVSQNKKMNKEQFPKVSVSSF